MRAEIVPIIGVQLVGEFPLELGMLQRFGHFVGYARKNRDLDRFKRIHLIGEEIVSIGVRARDDGVDGVSVVNRERCLCAKLNVGKFAPPDS